MSARSDFFWSGPVRPSFASTHLDEGFEPAGLSPFRASMRLPIVALLALLTTLCPDAEVNAQFNLRPVIEPYAQWPCSDWTWENCPQPVPHGGHTPAEWYEVTRWKDRTYGGTFGADTYVAQQLERVVAAHNLRVRLKRLQLQSKP